MRRRAVLLSLIIYLVVAYIAYFHTSLFGSRELPAPANGDSVQEVWFLSWPAYALTHGHNPFLTGSLNYPVGANLANSTALPLLGVVALPITLTLGPVASFNLLMVTALTISALSMCLVLRRWTRWWPAAFIGGLLYGFSPYMMGEGIMHVYLTFIPLPPIILLLLDDIVVRQKRNPVACGALLGLVAGAQYLISSEILAMTAVMAILGIGLLAATHWRDVLARASYVVKAVGVAAIICGFILAYPIWLMFMGPLHVVGPPQPLYTLSFYPGDLLGGFVPTISQFLGSSHLKTIGDHLSGENVVENGLYIGIPLVCVVTSLTIAFRHVRSLLFVSAMAVIAYILALGSHLTVDGHNTGVLMPYELLFHVPLLQDILPLRFSLFVQLFVAMALAIGIDRLWWWVDQRGYSTSTLRRWSLAAGPVVIAAVALLPLVPQLPITSAATDIPHILVGTRPNDIPPGSVLLTYPYPIDPNIQAMLLQANDGDRFKIIGGYAVVPSPAGTAQLAPTELDPTYVESMFNDAYSGTTLKAIPTNTQTIAWLREFLRRYQVDTVLVYEVGRDPQLVNRYITSTIGPPQVRRAGFRAWFGVRQLLDREGGSTGQPS
jgi:hypothetical protein